MSRWNIPASWQWTQVQDIADVIGGGTPAASDPTNFTDSGTPWITPADLSGYEETYIARGARSLSAEGLATSSARVLPPGSVLFSSRAPIGYTVIAANPIATNQGFKSLVLGEGIDPHYVRYYLIASREYVESLASGSTFKEISGARMKELLVPLPPIAEQHRIVAKLDELLASSRAARAALDAVPALLERYRQAVLAAAFRGELTATWRATHDSVRDEVGTASAEVDLPVFERYSIPVEWEWCLIADVCGVVRGASPRPAGDSRFFNGGHTPWITVGEITRDDSMFLDATSVCLTAEGRARSRYIMPNTLLLTNSGATLGVPKITRIGGCINDGSVALLGLDADDRRYLYYYLSAQTRRLRSLNQGAAQPNLNTGIVRSIPVPWPSKSERRVICDAIAERFRSLHQVAGELAGLAKQSGSLENAILAKAFRGELVPQHPADEPASALLERLTAARASTPARPRAARRPTAPAAAP